MKKAKRFLTLFLAMVLCFSLGGCAALDEMRANQGFWQLDGSVRIGETVYRPLSACEELCPEMDDGTTVYITNDDVPVLLSEMMGEPLDVSADGLFLQRYTGEWLYYCREDRYEEFEQRIQAGFTPDILCYSYEVYDREEGWRGYAYYDLTAEQADAVEYVYTTVIPDPVDDGFSFTSDESLYLWAASADHLFMRDAMLCIEAVGQAYYLSEEKADGTLLLYAVPTDMRGVFDGIFAAKRQADQAVQEYYEGTWDEEWL